jgi:8-oxo-dGTP pyrophosphatase MutT (NUDIX family)
MMASAGPAHRAAPATPSLHTPLPDACPDRSIARMPPLAGVHPRPPGRRLMRTLSCGILLLNPAGELLLCHVTGAWHWDIPKGGAEPGETPREAAVRETREECGFDAEAHDLLDLGQHRYRPTKDLHLFALLTERFDAAQCHCHSHYTDGLGRRRPEMDGFAWTPFDRVQRRCARHLGELLTRTLALPALLAQLQRQQGDGPPA